MCEYDALPDIGHACGHNLIAESSVAAAVAVKEVLRQESSTKGKVRTHHLAHSTSRSTTMLHARNFEGFASHVTASPVTMFRAGVGLEIDASS